MPKMLLGDFCKLDVRFVGELPADYDYRFIAINDTLIGINETKEPILINIATGELYRVTLEGLIYESTIQMGND